jgi:hypothetical protein
MGYCNAGGRENPLAIVEECEEMTERYSDRVHTETVVLDIGGDTGALIIYAEAELHGREIEVSPRGSTRRVHVEVLERRINGQPVFAAVFPGLRAGEYDIWENFPKSSGSVRIIGGQVATVDWRRV